jgi:hypothetical protein
MCNSKNVLWFWNFPHGRFGNAVFQYLFARYAEKQLSCEIVLGGGEKGDCALPWALFDLDDYSTRVAEISKSGKIPKKKLGEIRSRSPQHDIDEIREHFAAHPGSTLGVEGYFQYDTRFFFQDPAYASIFHKYLHPKEAEGNTFQRILAHTTEQINKVLAGHLIALHIRRGDYLDFSQASKHTHPIFYPLDLDKICEFLSRYVKAHRIDSPIVYIASDDLVFCETYFAAKNINIVTRGNLLSREQKSELNELMIDLSVLSASRLLISSNSSFSMIAALINTKARAFVRQTPDGKLIAFDPSATVVLMGN